MSPQSSLHPRITGTFIDEIASDNPSQNWGPKEWDADFAAMQGFGIDTVVLIRSGFRDRALFDSKVLTSRFAMLPAYEDMAKMFLDLAERYEMRLFFGLYNSYNYYRVGLYEKEIEINAQLIEEIAERYGSHPAFYGWYLSHEFSFDGMHIIDMYQGLGAKCREVLPEAPRLISPYFEGGKQQMSCNTGNPNQPLKRTFRPLTLDEHIENWQKILTAVKNDVDIIAFQDGGIEYQELGAYAKAFSELIRKHDIRFWMNVESFERDVPPDRPPIEWRKLRYKMEQADPHVEKLITFEFSKYMSPNSMYPTAHHLHQRYQDYLESANKA